MSPVSHAAISGIVSAVFAVASRSPAGTAACFLSGIFIDVDHAFDYWVAKRKLPFNYDKLFRFCGMERGGKLFLIFHSYEFLALLWAGLFVFPFNVVGLGIAVGLTVHVIIDQLANPLRPWALFFVYRLKHHFEKECVFPKDYYQKMTAS